VFAQHFLCPSTQCCGLRCEFEVLTKCIEGSLTRGSNNNLHELICESLCDKMLGSAEMSRVILILRGARSSSNGGSSASLPSSAWRLCMLASARMAGFVFPSVRTRPPTPQLDVLHYCDCAARSSLLFTASVEQFDSPFLQRLLQYCVDVCCGGNRGLHELLEPLKRNAPRQLQVTHCVQSSL